MARRRRILGLFRKKRRAHRGASRRRMPARNAKGRFVKRGSKRRR